MSEQEKKNNRIGFLTSVGIHGAIFFVLFFLVAWSPPDPPLPEFGIELNYGLDDQGSGDIQPDKPVGEEVETPAEEKPETKPQETQPEVKEQVKETKVDKASDLVQEDPSPVVVKEEKKEVKPEVKKEKPVEPPKEKVVAEYKKDDSKEAVTKDGAKKGTPGNQGDDTNKVGDKGSPEGTLDAKALYGQPGNGGGGGGNGTGLAMTGWDWAGNLVIPELPDNENGRIVFDIECDENGEIISIKTVERSLSAASEAILKREIQKNSLQRTSNQPTPNRSKGRFVFTLKNK